METKNTISKKITDMLFLTGLNQSGLADLLGTSRKNISKWKNKTHYPSPENIDAIIKLYEQITKQYGTLK